MVEAAKKVEYNLLKVVKIQRLSKNEVFYVY